MVAEVRRERRGVVQLREPREHIAGEVRDEARERICGQGHSPLISVDVKHSWTSVEAWADLVGVFTESAYLLRKLIGVDASHIRSSECVSDHACKSGGGLDERKCGRETFCIGGPEDRVGHSHAFLVPSHR
ncbi:hypothetical protein NS206_00290 [Microbacterium testaceum]|nr:hypothetical protein NS206_00290 [Microbacterium testaceum]